MDDSPIEIIARGALCHNHSVLLCQNRKHGHLFLPGGHVDFNEPAGVALLREVREELGVELELGRFLGVFESGFDQPRKLKEGTKRHHEINLVFELRPPAGTTLNPESLQSQEDHIQFVWAPITQMGEGKSFALLPHGIEAMLAPLSAKAPGNSSASMILSHFA